MRSPARSIEGEPPGPVPYGSLPPPLVKCMMVKRSDVQSVVYIIDDDLAVREALGGLFRSVGLQVKAFATPPELLASKLADIPSCLVLDVRLPGHSGLEFQTELAKANIHIPIIFITGHGDIP